MHFPTVLFPPPRSKPQKPKQSGILFDDEKDNDEVQLIDINNERGGVDAEEEAKEEAKFMPNDQKYYLFKYFENSEAELPQMLIEDAGVDPLDASIRLDKAKLEITVKTNKKNYDKIVKNL